MGVTFRRYSPADGPELLTLTNRIHGKVRDLRYWEWKFHQNPAGPALSCVVSREGRIIAHFGGMPMRFVVNGRPRTAVQDVDDVVDRANRTYQGVYQVNRCRREMHRAAGVDFMFGFAIEVTAEVSRTQYGYGRVARIPRLVRVLDHRPLLASRASTRFLAPWAAIANRPARTSRLPKGLRLTQVERFDERFDELWNRIKTDYPIMVVRDAAYLNWRYVDIPHVTTITLALENSSTREVLGFVVLMENHDDIPRGRILDVVTPRGGDECWGRLLVAQAVSHFASRHVALVACWMFPHCHLMRALRAQGFRPRVSAWRDIMFRNAELDHPAIPPDFALDPQNWFLAMGDSDLS